MAASPPQPIRPTSQSYPEPIWRQNMPAYLTGRFGQVALAFIIALAVLGQGLSVPFIKDAEPQSAQWIADIVDNGNWLLPKDYYHLVNRKPPLFYWLSALACKVSRGHVDELHARVVSLIAGAALAAEVMAWTAGRLGASVGWLAFVFLLGTYGFASRATVALTDMLLTFLLFSISVVLMPQLQGADSWRRTMAAGVMLGLAVLTKGPLAVVLLALTILIYLLAIRANPLNLVLQSWPWVVLAFGIAVACAWYVPAFIAGRAANVGAVLFEENVGHFLPMSAGGTGEAARPAYYIGLRIIGGAFPLSLLIPAVVLSSADFAENVRRDLFYQLAMALAVLVLFSIASAKRDDYILPALPPIAILFAAQFSQSDGTDDGSRRLAARVRDAAVAGSAITLLVGIFVIFILGRGRGALNLLSWRMASSDQSYAVILVNGITRLTPRFMMFLILALAGAGVALAGVCYRRPLVSGGAFGLLCVAASTLWIGTVKPMEAATRSVAKFAANVRTKVGISAVYVAHPDPEFSWYFGRGVPVVPRSIAVSGPSPGVKTFFVARPSDLATIGPSVRTHLRLIMASQVQGSGGPPSLYLFEAAK